MSSCGGSAYNPRRRADNDRARGNISQDRRARAHDGVISNAQARQDSRAKPDERAGSDPHPSGQQRAGADVRSFPNFAFVIDYAACVRYDRVADSCFGTDHRAGGDDDIAPDRCGRGNARGRVNRVDQLQARIKHQLRIADPYAVISNRHDGTPNLLVAELRQQVDLPKHSNPADTCSRERRVCVQKPGNTV